MEPTPEQIQAYLAWRDGQSAPVEVGETYDADASVDHISAAVAVDKEMHVKSNDQNNFYFAFFFDIFNEFKIFRQASAPVACLGHSQLLIY